MGDLRLLQDLILESEQDIETRYYQDSKFLKVTKFVSSNKGLRYLPSIYLIFSALDNGNLCMRILSFNGRTLSTLFFKLVDSQVPNKVTKALEDIQVGAKSGHA